jgi:hypothetical protein
MAETPTRDFGKRRSVAAPTAQPVKRSGHVALLLMGTFAVGGSAYMLMPRSNCAPDRPGIAAAPGAETGGGCSPRGTSPSFGHGAGGSSWRSSLFGGDSSSRASSATSSESGSSGVTRGGFGGFASAFGFSGRG